jgi:hypothetical protein
MTLQATGRTGLRYVDFFEQFLVQQASGFTGVGAVTKQLVHVSQVAQVSDLCCTVWKAVPPRLACSGYFVTDPRAS